MQALKRSLVSEAEFLSLPETLSKVELVDGEVVVSPSPTWWHQEISRRLVISLSNWAAAQDGAYTVVQSPSDVRFGLDRILQPDLFVLAGTLPREHLGPIERVPLLCVEVLSTDRVYDRVTKRMIYARAGVVEYWVVESAEVIERWSGPGLDQAEEVRQTLTSPVLPGLPLDVQTLFAQ